MARRRCRNCPEERAEERQRNAAVRAAVNAIEQLGTLAKTDQSGETLTTLKRLHGRIGEIIQINEA